MNKYETKSLSLATFLIAKGMRLENVDKKDRRSQFFIFEKTKELDHLVDKYSWGGLLDDIPERMVNVKEYEMARDKLLDIINET